MYMEHGIVGSQRGFMTPQVDLIYSEILTGIPQFKTKNNKHSRHAGPR